MLGIDLSTLSRPELQRLLKVTLERGDGALAERLEWELESRGKGGGRRMVPVAPPPQDDPDEDDPDEEESGETLDEAAAEVIEPDVKPFTLEPLTLEPIGREPTAPRPASGRGGLLLLVLGLVAGCLISGGVFWGLGWMDRSPPAQSAQAPTLRAMVASPLELAPPPRPEPAPVAPDAAPLVPAMKPPVEVATKAAPPEETIAKKEPPSRPPPTVRLAEADVTTRKPVKSGACARSTPADRLVCNDLSLQLFDLQLQDAYRRALNARVDPTVVGEGQEAWRRVRDEVSDPQRLAHLYNERIQELDAATSAAHQSHPPQ
jgi:uncharacterized protein YecT (DUF1311 family)